MRTQAAKQILVRTHLSEAALCSDRLVSANAPWHARNFVSEEPFLYLAQRSSDFVFGKEVLRVSHCFELESVVGGVFEEHRPLLVRRPLEPQCRSDEEVDTGCLQPCLRSAIGFTDSAQSHSSAHCILCQNSHDRVLGGASHSLLAG